MEAHAVPPALRSRLGSEATAGLLVLLDLSHREARETVIEVCTERFGRRLVDEISKVRVEMAHLGATQRDEMACMRADLRQELAVMGAGLRQEIGAMGAELRQELAGMRAELRQEMAMLGADLRQELAGMRAELRQELAGMGAELRQEMAVMGARLRQDVAAGRVELFKWCFLFWIGQVLAIGGLLGAMVRLLR